MTVSVNRGFEWIARALLIGSVTVSVVAAGAVSTAFARGDDSQSPRASGKSSLLDGGFFRGTHASLACTDQDADGFFVEPGCGPGPDRDCDDTRATVYPGALQVCDGVNNDCDDPSWPAVSSLETDGDGDGYVECTPWVGLPGTRPGDCDDARAGVNPGVAELSGSGSLCSDGLDDDCDGLFDGEDPGCAGWPVTLGVLNTNAATDDGFDGRAMITTDRAGHYVAVWTSDDSLGGTSGPDFEIFVSSSANNGATWAAPRALNSNAAADFGWDRYPAIATDRAGHWVAVWQSTEDLNGEIGEDDDIFVSRSVDNGATWTDPQALNTNAATDTEWDESAAIATDNAGHWVVIWSSPENLGGAIGDDGDILVARSTDNGVTWTAPAPLNTNAASDSGWDETPAITTDHTGHWVAVWSSNDSLGGTIGTDGDVLVSRSSDNGVNWTTPRPLNGTAATDQSSDLRPKIETDGSGVWVAAWEGTLSGTGSDDVDVLMSRSVDNGATWSLPRALNTNAATDLGWDEGVAIAADGTGDWVAAWHSTDDLSGTIGSDEDVLVSRSADAGVTWSAPRPLNHNAAIDSGSDVFPTLAADGRGHWVAAWESNDTLGGTIDEDWDVLDARWTWGPETCNGIDDDLDGRPDEGCDDDRDGYCDAAMATSSPPPAACPSGGGDCNDSDATVYPGAAQRCDGKNNDCNAGYPAVPDNETDGDRDGYVECSPWVGPSGTQGGDCDDTRAAVRPGAVEGPQAAGTCSDLLDNDCDGSIDLADTGCTASTCTADKPLVSGWNLVGSSTHLATTAEGLCQDVTADGGQPVEVDRWVNGGWSGHRCGLPFNNFPVDDGRGYMVKVNGASTWRQQAVCVSSPLTIPLAAGWNTVALPTWAGTTIRAQALCDEIARQGGCPAEVDRWVGGGWLGHVCGPPFNNFLLEPGSGYFVKVTCASSYRIP